MGRSRNGDGMERTRYPGVWKKPSGRYEARWTLNGKKYGKTFDTMDEARSYRRRMLDEVERGTAVTPSRSRTTFATYADEWMAGKHDIEPTTKAGYRSYLNARLLPAFGSRSLGKLTRADVKRFVAGMVESGLSPATTGKVLGLLRQMLAEAVADGYVSVNVADGVTAPRPPKPDRQFLSAPEVRRLADEFRPQYRALVYVLAYGGLRSGEAAALRRRDCDLLRRRLHVGRNAASVSGYLSFGETKSHQVRSVSLPAFVAEELARHLEAVPADPDALVFTSPTGKPLRYGNFRRNDWNPAAQAAGFGVWSQDEDGRKHWTGLTPHELRHTCASLLIAVGEQPKAVSAQLGHASVSFTYDTYGHLFDGHMDESMDALDRLHREASIEQDNVRRLGS
jgi:integrase